MELLKGVYSSAEAAELLFQLMQVKIKFHERKIEKSQNEEDIKMRENRIRELQHDLSELRGGMLQQGKACSLHAVIHID